MPNTPQFERDLLKKAQAICDNLSNHANNLGLDRQFTLDGLFVGDVGELIVFQHFAIDLPRRRHGGFCNINGLKYEVQVCCRRKCAGLDLKRKPQILLVIKFDDNWERWEVVYNGPGSVVEPGRRLYLKDLEKATEEQLKSSEKPLAVPCRSAANK